jgi:hypothetical protein
MATYLYCLLPPGADAPPGALAGVAGSAVRALPADGFIAWVSDVAGAPPPSAAALAEHDAVTAAAVEGGATPLPMRFGQLFASDEACVASLAARRDSLQRGLSGVAGCVEMTVSLALDPGDPAPAANAGGAGAPPVGQGAGRAYMERLREARARERLLAERATAAAAPISAAVRPFVRREVRTLRASPPVLHLSHLIARGDISAYRRVLAGLEAGESEQPPGATATLVHGPSAPYSFATRDDD